MAFLPEFVSGVFPNDILRIAMKDPNARMEAGEQCNPCLKAWVIQRSYHISDFKLLINISADVGHKPFIEAYGSGTRICIYA